LLSRPLCGWVGGNMEAQNCDAGHGPTPETRKEPGSGSSARFRRTMYLLTLLSAMWKPSLSSSPWMRGAPQRGFSRHILRIGLGLRAKQLVVRAGRAAPSKSRTSESRHDAKPRPFPD
jgi:hypothetical protein